MDSKTQAREADLGEWARERLQESRTEPGTGFQLAPVSDDASFRRYFRGLTDQAAYIFVDAPPDKEDSAPFVRIAGLLQAAGLNVPRVLASDLERGFMMLTDLGDTQLQDILNRGPAEAVLPLYDAALVAIHQMQEIDAALPAFDEALLRREMALFTEWFLPGQLGIETTQGEAELIESVFTHLVGSALEQPACFVHRDFHCRNIMVQADLPPGILDFQDAVTGPVTYDLVSLLRDCYHRFEPDTLDTLLGSFYSGLVERDQIVGVDQQRFRRWFDWMGMQRHLKCAGIFSRLNLRDAKPRYLRDIPLVFSYIQEVAHRYPEFAAFGDWLDKRIAPGVAAL